VLFLLFWSSEAFRFSEPSFAVDWGNIYTNTFIRNIELIDASRYNRNYTGFVPADPSGCVVDPNDAPFVKGSAVFLIDFGCRLSYEPRINSYTAMGAGAILFATPLCIAPCGATAWNLNDWTDVSAKTPTLMYRDAYGPTVSSPPGGLDFAAITLNPPGQYNQYAALIIYSLIGQNITIFLNTPERNDILGATTYDSSHYTTLGIAIFMGMTYYLILLVLFSSKLTLFAFHEGKIQMSMPQICLGLCTFGCIISVFWYTVGPFTWKGTLPFYPAYFFFDGGASPYVFISICLMGLYYGEITLLTSQDRSGTFQKLRIPAICVGVGMFLANYIIAAVWITTFTSLADPFGVLRAWAGVYGAMWCIILIFLGFGLVLLARALPSMSGQTRMSIIRTIIFGCIMLASIIAFGICYWWYLFEPPGLPVLYSYGIYQFMNWLYAGFPALLVFLSFRISISKEIEMSRSGTSSTSGSSATSKSSSGSSSSASQDPVIEL